MHERNSTYYHLYSDGSFTNGSYAMGYASSSSPTGAFAQGAANPIAKSTANVIGPGGGSVMGGPHRGDWTVYHGRATANGPRTVRIDPLVLALEPAHIRRISPEAGLSSTRRCR
jgi:glycosyl hydrolase family 43